MAPNYSAMALAGEPPVAPGAGLLGGGMAPAEKRLDPQMTQRAQNMLTRA